jgi:D-alanine-D-alanine ligase
MALASKIKVGVLRGGPSSEYEVSLKSGAAVLKNLPEKYLPVDIFVTREGIWNVSGAEHRPEAALRKVDVIFNAMHGEYGEDGRVQELLEAFGTPYNGSGVFASRLAMNKALAKSFLAREGIKTPAYKLVEKGRLTEPAIAELFRTTILPAVVKPVDLGSSVGVSIADDFPSFERALRDVFDKTDSALIEEYIKGREATCGVVENFNGERYHALPPIEIVPPPEASFFDYQAKYGGKTREICPGNFTEAEQAEIKNLAAGAHRILGLRHYSRSDFIIHPTRGIYFLESNTLPGLTAESLLPKSLYAVGVSLPQFLDHVLTLALREK